MAEGEEGRAKKARRGVDSEGTIDKSERETSVSERERERAKEREKGKERRKGMDVQKGKEEGGKEKEAPETQEDEEDTQPKVKTPSSQKPKASTPLRSQGMQQSRTQSGESSLGGTAKKGDGAPSDTPTDWTKPLFTPFALASPARDSSQQTESDAVHQSLLSGSRGDAHPTSSKGEEGEEGMDGKGEMEVEREEGTHGGEKRSKKSRVDDSNASAGFSLDLGLGL